MRIFVGFGFNPRDRWIKELVFPLISAFGDDVDTGEEVFGSVITEEVKERIRLADAVIGFATRRDQKADGSWTTHRWVTDELSHAIALDKHVVEVRENGVESQAGIGSGRQFLTFDHEQRERCLVGLVRVLWNLHKRQRIWLQLQPAECVKKILPLHKNASLNSGYRLLLNDTESPLFPAKLRAIESQLYMQMQDAPLDALVQVEIQYQDKTWISSYDRLNRVSVILSES